MQLHFKTFGEGPNLIILHGLLGSLDNWQTLAKKFAAHFTVYIIDQRNHGKSPHSNEFSYPILANDLFEFCQTHQIEKTHIIGHSMGGKTAMQFAIEHPHIVDNLIIADIAPVKYQGGHEVIFQSLLNADLTNAQKRSDVEQQIEKNIKNFSVRQFLMKGLTRDDNNQFTWKFNVEALWNNYQNILSALPSNESYLSPVLFIKGAKSDYVKDEYSTNINKHFPLAEIESIADAGHWLHAEKPNAFYDKSMDWLIHQ